MKNIINAGLLLFSLSICSCYEGSNYSINNHDGKTVISINDETGRLRLETRGSIAFTDDETGIKSISYDGYVKFRKNGNKLEAETNGSGVVVYTVNDGTPVTTLNENDRKVLVRAIKEMINVGFDAKNRASRLYTKGGSSAVLTAITDIRSDYVKSMYFEYLVIDNKLTSDEMTAVARAIGQELSSDYEKGKLLQKISTGYLDDERTATAYLDAVNTISSDYEKANAIKNVVDQPLTPAQYGQVLTITGNISSDYEKANVLKQLIGHGTPSENNANSFLMVTENISSDYEKAGVLKALLAEGVPVNTSFTKFLDVAGNIGSDYERSEVLKKMAKSNIASEDQWLGLIKETEKIAGDNEKSDVMIEIAKWMPKSDRVKTAYMLSAKTITAEYSYAQAIKAVN